MVAYKLKNTVSDFGTVTRGVCSLSGGKMTAVEETFKIGNISTLELSDAQKAKDRPARTASSNSTTTGTITTNCAVSPFGTSSATVTLVKTLKR